MNLKTLQQLSQSYPMVPVTLQYQVDQFDPVAVTAALQTPTQPCFLLTGQPKPNEAGYSFIGVRPQQTLTYRNGQLTVTTADKITQTKTALKPVLQHLMTVNQTPKIPGLPPFTGGLAGYFSYDYARYANPTLPQHPADPDHLNDADLLVVDQVIGYNHQTHQVTLSQLVSTATLATRYATVMADLRALKQRLATCLEPALPTLRLLTPLTLAFDLPTFTAKVAQTKQHIRQGDIFQLILSNPQRAQMTGPLFNLTRTLFPASPAPYQFYFRHGDFETVGASPETLIKKQGDKLVTYPLAGTRRRGRTAAEDMALARELMTSPKELAEHNMLIDLGRNDLGKVSQFGSVQVTRTRQLLKFSQVMHLGSTVESRVAAGTSPIDIIESLMPAGTLSGAPKVRAMQLISELEQRKRGIYGGCLGYLDFNGDLDFCIGIRLAYRQGAQLVVHSGAGIVADSCAKHEFQEFNHKARAVVQALKVVAQ
ncbi:anthranilate synthase component I family protein [Lactiplantibacillus songbeiensis]|uniref:Anthranilate synthase component 1 n=1 Tax=Lactiplantibacillus songbeiensis TaxID=2559920 RepID=A0ABW4BY65_9LACO|nr:anthranilate synthase component I family protein [Lactiplantibacillus songbeiensis]